MTKKEVIVISPKVEEHERYFILVYGSLRKNCERNSVLSSQQDSLFIKDIDLPHYTLYMHNGLSYPYAAYKRNAILKCELWQVSELTMNLIRAIEEQYTERPIMLQLLEFEKNNEHRYNMYPDKYDSPVCSLFVQPLSTIQNWQKQEYPKLVEIGADWVKWCKLNNNFCYKPNQQRARKGLPSFQELHEEKMRNLKQKSKKI